MAKVLTLTAITGAQIGRSYSVESRTAVIGSAPSADVQIQDRVMDPRHAELRQILDRWFIVPLTPSGAGLSLNGLPVTGQSRLNPGDKLTLGSTMYQVQVTEAEEREAGSSTGITSGVPRLGEYFRRRGIMSAEQIDKVAKRQVELQQSGSRITFGQLAYEMGYVNRNQLENALSDQREDFYQRFSG